MAQKIGKQGEWPTVKREPIGRFLTPDAILKSDQPLAGPLRMGTAPGVGPKGPAVIADYDTRMSDFGMDMIARDRKTERKFPSDLVAREIRGVGPTAREPHISEGKSKPK